MQCHRFGSSFVMWWVGVGTLKFQERECLSSAPELY